MSADDERDKTGILSLNIGHNAPPSGMLAVNIHTIAEATVDKAVQEAVQALTHTVVGATQWFVDAVCGELISQTVSASGLEMASIPAPNLDHNAVPDGVRSSSIHTVVKATVDGIVRGAVQKLIQVGAYATQRLDDVVHVELISNADSPGYNLVGPFRSSPQAEVTILPTNWALGATIHTVAKTTVDAVTKEAMADIVQAINRATEWISQAVENELISKCLDPNEGVAFHNATDWTTHAVLVDLIAHAADDAMQSGTSTTSEIHEHIRIPKVCSLPRHESIIADARGLAKLTAEEAVTTALETVTQVMGDASYFSVVACASLESEAHFEEKNNNSTDPEKPLRPPPISEENTASILVPILKTAHIAGECTASTTDYALPVDEAFLKYSHDM
ncbi:hypothetical protein GN244_ATG19141 [Phytophthora infestans]|uniref:Uncharacterized protein n=1 Tax=Phytophthora infestans TaxID=4787 RepID=A0A833W4B9_PHYIN|nr:hypothetical protein GN244_ATG19141 [Phytophthora infestans]KAF4139579.1 hypothetical protein GN958_ATG11230 [Phytophthora infestans]